MRSLAVTVALYSTALAVVLGVAAARGRRPGPRLRAALLLVQVAVTGLAVADLVTTWGRQSGPDAVTHLAYLATAVVLLPVGLTVVGPERSRWTTATLGVAALMLAVVVVRVEQTGPIRG